MTALSDVNSRDQVSGIDEPQANPARNRRGNVAITELDLVVLNDAFIILDRSLFLQNHLLLVFQSLAGNSVLRPRLLVPGEVHFGLFQQILIALERALRLL